MNPTVVVDGAFLTSSAAHIPSPLPVADDATIALAAATTNIPVNANNTNGSMWQNNGTLVGLPLVRDFDLSPMRDLHAWDGAGAPPSWLPVIADPDLKKLTATVGNGAAAGVITVTVSYPNASTGGRIRLWADQAKTTPIDLSGGIFKSADEVGGVGTLTAYPTADIYVEGIRPSLSIDDITLRVSYTRGEQTVATEQKLTVTPVVKELTLTPKTPAAPTFVRDALGDIWGVTSGSQAANGDPPNSGDVGLKFFADVSRSGISGRAAFVQNVMAVTNGGPAGVVLLDGTRQNLRLTDNQTYPILDLRPQDPGPYYGSLDVVGPTEDRHAIYSNDSPGFGLPPWNSQIASFDLRFDARLHLVWRFPDESMYTLASADWQVVFHATGFNFGAPFGGYLAQMLPDSRIEAFPTIIQNVDPERVSGPSFNDKFRFV